MTLSGGLYALGWIFSFLSTVYGILLAAANQKWIKDSFINKLVSDPLNTFIVFVFFGLIAVVSFILSNHIKSGEEKIEFESLKAEIIQEFSDISKSSDINKIEKIFEGKGIKVEDFLKMLSEGSASDQGLKLLYEKDYDEAIKKFKEATQGNEGDNGLNWLNIGNAYYFNEEYKMASESYENSTKSAPQIKAAWNNWGAALMKQGLYDKAVEKFQHVEKMDSSDETNLVNWGATLGEQNKFEDAIQKFEQALSYNPKSCTALYNWGLTLGKMGEFKEALNKYRRAVKLCPKYGSAWSNMGWCLEKQGDYKGAIEAYEKALEIRPNHAPTWINLGWSLTQLGKTEEAIEKYRHAVGLDPNNEGAWVNLCNLILHQQKYKDVDKTFNEAVKNIPDSASLWLNWGLSMFLRGDIEAAIEKFEIASSYNVNFAPIWSNWSLALTALGKTEEALEKIEIAVKLEPNEAGYWINYGLVLKSLGRREEAQQKFVKAQQLGGKIPEQTDTGSEINLFLKTLSIEANDLKSDSPKEKAVSAIEEQITEVQLGIQRKDELQHTEINRPYITLEPLRNEDGIYWTIEKNGSTANIYIDLEMKNRGSIAANNITFPNNISIRSKMKIQAVHKLTPIITLVPNDSVKLRIGIIIDFKSPEDLLSEINRMNSYKFDGYHFGCTIVYENELDATKKYALSVLYIIKRNHAMVLKLEDRHM